MIIQDEEKLSIRCEDVGVEEGSLLLKKLSGILEPTGGIGLAANQIGILKRACVIKLPDQTMVGLLNPKVIELKIPFVMKNEGCLSFPDEYIETLRFAQVKVEDLLAPEGRVFTGITAVIAQHEIDHLNGITMYRRQIKNLDPNEKCACGSNKPLKLCCGILMRKNKPI